MEFAGRDIDNISVTSLIDAIEDEVYQPRKNKPHPKFVLNKNYNYILQNPETNSIKFTNICYRENCIKNPFKYNLRVLWANEITEHWGNTIDEVLKKANISRHYFYKHRYIEGIGQYNADEE
jgi:hypothetical protein